MPGLLNHEHWRAPTGRKGPFEVVGDLGECETLVSPIAIEWELQFTPSAALAHSSRRVRVMLTRTSISHVAASGFCEAVSSH